MFVGGNTDKGKKHTCNNTKKMQNGLKHPCFKHFIYFSLHKNRHSYDIK